MATTPKFVRLAERLNRTIVADVAGGSGWSIAGLDVKEFPVETEEPAAYQFVVQALRDGRLEASDQAQYDAVQYANDRVATAGEYDEEAGETINEGAVQAEAKRAFRDLVKGAVAPVDEVEDEEVADDFEAMTRDELVEYANEVHSLELAGNVSKADALAAVREAEAG